MITVCPVSTARLVDSLLKPRPDFSRALGHWRVLPFVRLMLTMLRNQETTKPEVQRRLSKTQTRPKNQSPLTKVPTSK